MQIDDLYYSVFFGDKEDPWPDAINPVDRITIFNRMVYGVTALELVLVDKTGWFGSKMDLVDGLKIRIDTSNGDGIEVWRFRMVKNEQVGPQLIKIYGFADKPSYIHNASTGYYEGTTSEAIKKLAADTGLEVEADETSDKQVWLGNGRKNLVFARSMALHGYAGANSLMWLAYYKDKLLYKDINAIKYDTPVARFTAAESGKTGNVRNHLIFKVESLSDSGLNNANGGYGAKLVEQNLMHEEAQVFDSVQVRQRADKPQVNADVKKAVSTPPTITGQIRTDNTHAKYNEAVYQNLRGMTMLSERIMVSTKEQTKVGMFAPVEVVAGALISKAEQNQNQAVDGKWLTISRNVQITGNHYLEIFELRREGIQ